MVTGGVAASKVAKNTTQHALSLSTARHNDAVLCGQQQLLQLTT